MKLYPFLKITRVAAAVIIIILISFIFFDIYNLISPSSSHYLALTQFIPSMISFINLPSIVFTSFIIVILLTLAAGRSYCSFLCPLGIFQDVISRTASVFHLRKKFSYSHPHNLLRFSILILVIVSYSAAGTVLIIWLDPFSVYGRFSSVILSPAATLLNNITAVLLSKSDIYTMHAVDIKYAPAGLLLVVSVLFISISALAAARGRLYCNTICPVGSLLALVSGISLFRITINKNSCIHCGRCENVCKSSCIDQKNEIVDFSRCVSCFNCLKSCPNNSIKFELSRTGKNKLEIGNIEKTDFEYSKLKLKITKKTFMAGIFLLPSVVSSQVPVKNRRLFIQDISRQKYYKKKVFASPPGSLDIEKFNKNCTACSLCITKCPSSVLQPAVMHYGMAGIMQPYLDCNTGYCNYDCTICGDICPTDAIKQISVAEKHLIQTGKSFFIKENCITFTNGTDCGACSEHCPTKAVNMIPFRDKLVIPEVNRSICIGCGACEFVCPVRPIKAMYVEGNRIHEKAELPKKVPVIEKKKTVEKEDFPF